MEEFHGSAGALTGPEDHAAPAPLDAGRLGGFLCQLQRKRFDGLLQISSREQSASIGFRAGTPVTFDDPTPGHTLAEQLIERGQLTRAQCNSVLAGMTDALVEDESVAFFEHAVRLGFLTDEEASVELSARIRARMIQLFAWRDCQTTLLEGTAALLERRELPQNLGTVLYMGVRTFYEEELLTSLHPDLTQTFVRLSGAPATIAHFFGLDDEEFQLLRRIHPEQSLSQLLSDPRVDRAHLLSLVLLMQLSQLCEVANAPLLRQSPARYPRIHSDVRNTEGSVARRAPGPADQPEPSPVRTKTGSSYSTVGPFPEEHSAPRSRHGSSAGPLPDHPPAPGPLRSKAGSGVGPLPDALEQSTPRSQTGSSAGLLPDPPAPRAAAKASVDATQEALLEAAARTARMRRSIPARRNSKQAEPLAGLAADSGSPHTSSGAARTAAEATATSQNAAGSGAAQPGAQKSIQPGDPRGDYAKAHLKELIARRKQAANAPESAAPSSSRDAVRELREARGLLHAQQYSRAEKVLASLVELEPDNELWKTYHLWSRWRVQPDAAEELVSELQELAKKLLSEPEHAAFAAYVLGYVFLHHKRDDLAEKFFKRAHGADRGNKDAERHLLILERRKQAAADGGGGANRKLFGIQLPNSKPKP